MTRLDTSGWKEFLVGELFEKLDLKFLPERDFNKGLDISEFKSDEFSLPLVNAKHSNNGIMYYGRKSEWESASMTIDIVADGAASTGDVYVQPQETGVLYNAYLVKPKVSCATEAILFFLATVVQRCVKDHFGYDNKCTWEKVKLETVMLPVDAFGEPDWAYMNEYMAGVMAESEASLGHLKQADGDKRSVDVSGWHEFVIEELFSTIVKPPVLHTRQVVESDEGLPYVVRTKFDNGIKCRVQPVDGVEPSPAGVITWGAENATFFYQAEPFLSGRDIYFIDTREYSPMACIFLTSCLQTITHKYPYNFGLFPDLLKKERIKLPVNASGEPDWAYMDEYMRMVTKSVESDLSVLKVID